MWEWPKGTWSGKRRALLTRVLRLVPPQMKVSPQCLGALDQVTIGVQSIVFPSNPCDKGEAASSRGGEE